MKANPDSPCKIRQLGLEDYDNQKAIDVCLECGLEFCVADSPARITGKVDTRPGILPYCGRGLASHQTPPVSF